MKFIEPYSNLLENPGQYFYFCCKFIKLSSTQIASSLITVKNHSSNIGGSIHILQQKKARENTKDLFKSRAEKLILYSSYSCFCNKKYRHERPVNLPIIYTTYAILFPILKLNFCDRNI